MMFVRPESTHPWAWRQQQSAPGVDDRQGGAPTASLKWTSHSALEGALARKTLMIKDITMHLDGSDRDDRVIHHAAALCQRFDAHLTGLYINVLPEIVVTGDIGGGSAIDWQLRDKVFAVGDEAEARLRTKLTNAWPTSEFRRREIYPIRVPEEIATLSRVSDLTVVARPYGDPASEPDPSVLEGALFGSGRGVLVVPPEREVSSDYRSVLIGWRNVRESARAVAESLPLLHAADRVFIVMVDEDGAPAEDGEEPAADIARHLDRHGLAVEIRHLSKWERAGAGLINEANVLGAELIVAGGYGHSRLREWAIGGTTRDLLTDSPVPLLMAH